MAYIPKITHVWKWVTAKRRSSFSWCADAAHGVCLLLRAS